MGNCFRCATRLVRLSGPTPSGSGSWRWTLFAYVIFRKRLTRLRHPPDAARMLIRFLCASLLTFALAVTERAAGVAEHFVLVVWDGLRPDSVTPELTPTLWQLRTNGVWFDRHHPVYPSSTEVNGVA